MAHAILGIRTICLTKEKKDMKGVYLLALNVLLPSCASLSTEGVRVRVTNNHEVVRGCKFIKNVKASSGWEEGTGEDQVEIKMQNETAKAGGNVLFISSNRGAKVWFSRGSGEAYKCPQH